MRYVIVSVVRGSAGIFNNNLRKEVYQKFKARSSKLPPHFTIKAPFECDDMEEIEIVLEDFSKTHNKSPYRIKGYDHFDNRVIFMKVLMSDVGQKVHDELIDDLSKIEYINFDKIDGKNKIFHVTISSKRIQKIYTELWEYVTQIPCEFNCFFDNITIYKWENNTWIMHKEYNL